MFNNIIEPEKIKNFPDKISECQLKINPIEKKRKFKVEVYDHDVKIIIEENTTIKKPRKGGGLKKSITKFSKKSSKNLKFHMNNTKNRFSNMITLTYPSEYSNNGIEIKYHLNRFTKFLKLKKCEYTWIIEFQKRGAPHFHLLTDTYIDKKEVSQVWYDIVNSGDEKHLVPSNVGAGYILRTFKNSSRRNKNCRTNSRNIFLSMSGVFSARISLTCLTNAG